MIEATSDTTTAETRLTCQRMVWVRGEDRRCGQSVGVTSWTDHTGQTHYACPRHIDGMKRRSPAAIPESLVGHGILGLSTPWARGAFGPADRIEVENLIPQGWTIGVSAYRGNYGRFSLWLRDPDGTDRARWENRTDVVAASRQLAALAVSLADPPEPEWLHEQADPITSAKAEADRQSPEPSWTEGPDGYVQVPLDWHGAR